MRIYHRKGCSHRVRYAIRVLTDLVIDSMAVLIVRLSFIVKNEMMCSVILVTYILLILSLGKD